VAASSQYEGVVWYRAPASSRVDAYGSATADAAVVLLSRYHDELRREPDLRRDYRAIVGTHELRAGHRTRALAWFVRSWMARPTDPRAAARIASVAVPLRLRRALPGGR
jgi:hypothetical protein